MAIEESIRSSMDEWISFVKIRDIDVTSSKKNPNLINVRLQFFN